jgi:hypothetical protein
MCVSLLDMTASCESAAGGVARVFGILSEDVASIASIDGTTKIIPQNGLVYTSTAKMFEFDFIKNSEGGKADLNENDLGTPQSPAYESLLSFSVKGNGAVNRAYLNEVRKGFRGVLGIVTNSGQIFLMGTKSAPAVLRKYTRKFGNDLEAANVQELEFYYKSAVGLVEYAGTVADLTTVGLND